MSEFVGIDVSKTDLECRAHVNGQCLVLANSEAGLDQLVTALKVLKPELIVMEASGGYERLSAAVLTQAGFAVAVVNARQVRAFAIAAGVLAKTDRVDARVLAHFAAAIRPASQPLAEVWTGEAYREFRAALLTDRPPMVCRGCSAYRGVF